MSTNPIRDHYEHLLAAHYTWTTGDFTARSDAERAWLATQGVRGTGHTPAIDLGAGAGCHAVALAHLGYAVTAIDLSPSLIGELVERTAGLDVTAIVGDLLDVERWPAAELIVCLGDTLTHLPTVDDVRRLFAAAHARLSPGGKFVLGYRDLSVEVVGTARFIPVRSDEHTIFTCFLEYLPDRVLVHDLVHARGPSGWSMQASAYPKLRLARADVERWLVEVGFVVRHASSERGVVRFVATCGTARAGRRTRA